jgi:hypothetical protein
MKLVSDAPNRSVLASTQSFQGPYPHLQFVGKLIADAFRALRDRFRSR